MYHNQKFAVLGRLIAEIRHDLLNSLKVFNNTTYLTFITKREAIVIGLAVSKSFVKKHEGKIVVTSDVGKVSTFTVNLPIQGRADKFHE